MITAAETGAVLGTVMDNKMASDIFACFVTFMICFLCLEWLSKWLQWGHGTVFVIACLATIIAAGEVKIIEWLCNHWKKE